MSSMKVLRFFRAMTCVLSLGIVIVLGFTPSAHALFDDTKFSESEKVGFAFYQLGKLKPQFDSWIKGTDIYKFSKPEDKSTVLQKEQYRLLQGYYDYKLADDYIHVSFPVKYKLKDADAELQIQGAVIQESGKAIEITLEGATRDFFGFRVGGIWIAVAAENFENPTTLYLKKEEFRVLLDRVGTRAYSKKPITGQLDIYMQPISVDLKNPISSKGQKLWLMLTKIGSIVIWNDSRTKIMYQYAAPWYHGPIDKQLLDLYND